MTLFKWKGGGGAGAKGRKRTIFAGGGMVVLATGKGSPPLIGSGENRGAGSAPMRITLLNQWMRLNRRINCFNRARRKRFESSHSKATIKNGARASVSAEKAARSWR